MDSTLGRWLLLVLILLIALSLMLLIPALLQLLEPAVPPVVLPSSTVPATAKPLPSQPTPTATLPPATAVTPPTASPTPYPSVTPLPPQVGYTVHVVSTGETLEQIAGRYGSLPLSIASLNRFPPGAELGEGQVLVIPLFAGIEPAEPVEVRGQEIDRGFPGQRVALTLDAGASAEPAGQILDALKAYDVQITFFLTGQWAEDNPGLVRRMAAEGHEFGNHTYSHPYLTQLDESTIREEIQSTETIIRSLVGQSTRPFLRPPYGDRDRRVWDLLAEEGYVSIYWTLDSLDAYGDPKTPDYLLERVSQAEDGAIILMHIGSPTTAEALPNILARFQEKGWEVVRLSEILRP